ncbi:hypothetical protein GNI_116040 [Gregarina niphandrodes]|uniref:Uncharacterized protein n=1 Tax=Gregarina niphandrodes TaxID=110365 RepID=A0A023B3C2_GRENI|nr:hypothetical protein GNI_116040 [Gregarina niphandrodes]EZG55214.1 hypothetical protein GNI_116040 [Gregarina niphandrodes]|eukprot:XP_011131709.1 hypothetical protein GNI_116040 [Gregarina niphandrodes]
MVRFRTDLSTWVEILLDSCGQSLWKSWLKNTSRELNVDELVISPPLKTILKCFERC